MGVEPHGEGTLSQPISQQDPYPPSNALQTYYTDFPLICRHTKSVGCTDLVWEKVWDLQLF